MENIRLQQIAAMQHAMINSMSQEIAKQGEVELEVPERKLLRPMEPVKIATPETLSPHSSLSSTSTLLKGRAQRY